MDELESKLKLPLDEAFCRVLLWSGYRSNYRWPILPLTQLQFHWARWVDYYHLILVKFGICQYFWDDHWARFFDPSLVVLGFLGQDDFHESTEGATFLGSRTAAGCSMQWRKRMRPWTRRLGKLLASSLSACDHPFCATDLGDGDGNRGKPWAKPLRKPRDLLRPLMALENFVEKRARDSGQAVDL
jgi:hypothetical protein